MNITKNISNHLGYYVYRLIDPRNGETFYVGKGKNDRVLQHLKNVLSENENDVLTLKEDRIQSILNSGMEPLHIIHRHGLDKATAFEVEGALIDAYPGLTNDQGGHNNAERGAMNLQQIINIYELPSFPNLEVPAALINVNNIEDKSTPESIYRQVRGHWKVNGDRMKQAELIIAVERGVAIGIFRPHHWYPSEILKGRKCFEGSIAFDLWETYVGKYGKRIEQMNYKHSQFPIRYVNL
jgi:hypothetical protein